MNEVLNALLSKEIVSGGQLSREIGITRAAIWKQVTVLREQGFQIEAVGHQGYRLLSAPDRLMVPLIQHDLGTRWAGQNMLSFESVDSTNRVLRGMAAEGAVHGTLVVAEEQTQGRGRRGRGWLTPKGTAIAMSLLLRPELPPAKVALLSLGTSVAVALGIRDVTGLLMKIKWPNDIVCNGKKVCGILLEMDANEQSIQSVVAGVGINVHQQEFPEEIQKTATSLDRECGHAVSRVEVIRAILRRTEDTECFLQQGTLLDQYLALSATLGQNVSVIAPTETFQGKAERITETGTLVVELPDGELREVVAGDVSVRGLMGYV